MVDALPLTNSHRPLMIPSSIVAASTSSAASAASPLPFHFMPNALDLSDKHRAFETFDSFENPFLGAPSPRSPALSSVAPPTPMTHFDSHQASDFLDLAYHPAAAPAAPAAGHAYTSNNSYSSSASSSSSDVFMGTFNPSYALSEGWGETPLLFDDKIASHPDLLKLEYDTKAKAKQLLDIEHQLSDPHLNLDNPAPVEGQSQSQAQSQSEFPFSYPFSYPQFQDDVVFDEGAPEGQLTFVPSFDLPPLDVADEKLESRISNLSISQQQQQQQQSLSAQTTPLHQLSYSYVPVKMEQPARFEDATKTEMTKPVLFTPGLVSSLANKKAKKEKKGAHPTKKAGAIQLRIQKRKLSSNGSSVDKENVRPRLLAKRAIKRLPEEEEEEGGNGNSSDDDDDDDDDEDFDKSALKPSRKGQDAAALLLLFPRNLALLNDAQWQQERKRKLERYRKKRHVMSLSKRILYPVRQKFANVRPRVGGRFVKIHGVKPQEQAQHFSHTPTTIMPLPLLQSIVEETKAV